MIYILLVISLIAFGACGNAGIEAELDTASRHLEVQPELSLKLLENIDQNKLSSDKQRARYSLLYSIALDKNYIDITDDSIIAPAVKYYSDHGDAQSRFLCHYYEARIYENAGDVDNALLCISKAERSDTSKVDAGTLSMLYAMKCMIYDGVWRSREAIQAGELARKYALMAGKYRHYAYYCLSTSAAYRRCGDKESSRRNLSDAEPYKSYFTLLEKHLYQDLVICHMMDSDVSGTEVLAYTERYLSEYPQYDMINWRNIARVYQEAGQFEKASEMLALHSEYNDVSSDAGFHSILSELKEASGDYEKALYAQRTYSLISDAEALRLHKSDLRLVEERYEGEINLLNQKHRTTQVILLLAIACMLLGYVFYRWNKERRANKRELEELQREYEILSVVKDKVSRLDGAYQYLNEQSERKSDTESEMLKILGYRIGSLAAFLQQPTPDSLSKVAVQIDNLKKNRNYIVDSIGILYAVNYPEFISELRGYGLTSSEIGYCCLFLIGLNMPEAGKVIGKPSSIYNINSAIRKKMNLPTSSTNLDKWLLNRFNELYPTRTMSESK